MAKKKLIVNPYNAESYYVCTHHKPNWHSFDRKGQFILYVHYPKHCIESDFVVIYEGKKEICTQYYDDFTEVLQDIRVLPYINTIKKYRKTIMKHIDDLPIL